MYWRFYTFIRFLSFKDGLKHLLFLPHRNKAILFYFNILQCANPTVLINLQCPTTQVIQALIANHLSFALMDRSVFSTDLFCNWSLSFSLVHPSCVYPSAQTDSPLTSTCNTTIDAIRATGNTTSNFASRASTILIRYHVETGECPQEPKLCSNSAMRKCAKMCTLKVEYYWNMFTTVVKLRFCFQGLEKSWKWRKSSGISI